MTTGMKDGRQWWVMCKVYVKKLTWACDKIKGVIRPPSVSRNNIIKTSCTQCGGPSKDVLEKSDHPRTRKRTSSPSGVKTVILFLLIYWAILALVYRYSHCLNHGTAVRVALAVLCVARAAGGWPAGVPASLCTSWGKCWEARHPPCPGKGFLPHQCKCLISFYIVKGKAQ